MKIILLDVYWNTTYMHRLTLETGEFKRIRNLEGTHQSQIEQILLFLITERPHRIIIDKSGLGKNMKELLTVFMTRAKMQLEEDGTIVYL